MKECRRGSEKAELNRDCIPSCVQELFWSLFLMSFACSQLLFMLRTTGRMYNNIKWMTGKWIVGVYVSLHSLDCDNWKNTYNWYAGVITPIILWFVGGWLTVLNEKRMTADCKVMPGWVLIPIQRLPLPRLWCFRGIYLSKQL